MTRRLEVVPPADLVDELARIWVKHTREFAETLAAIDGRLLPEGEHEETVRRMLNERSKRELEEMLAKFRAQGIT